MEVSCTEELVVKEAQQNEKYLITGGTGVVGYALCERILKTGGKV